MSMDYLKTVLNPPTQKEPLPGQVQNSGGGFSYQLDDWGRLDRFLILGSEGGSYYASEKKLTKENAIVVTKLAQDYGKRLVSRIVEISESGRAPKNDPAIFALAVAARTGNEETRRLAYAAVPSVCRIGTHLYHFVQFADQLGGWGRGLRRAVADWFNKKPADKLTMQMIKYQSRDGWSARDLLRLSHPVAASKEHGLLYKWATSGEFDNNVVNETTGLEALWAFEQIKRTENQKNVIDLITTYKLPRECVPTQWLTKPEIWEVLLPHMGLTALIRNLGNMSKVGLVVPLSKATGTVLEKLGNAEELRKSRVHPLAILVAMNTYQAGRGVKGSSTWNPVQQVVDALDAAFYTSFGNVRPMNKSTLLALDCSASMTWSTIAGMTGITPRVGSAAMALITANVEPNYHVLGFSRGLLDVRISPKMRLTEVINTIERLPTSATDCAVPFLWAAQTKTKVESFAIYTDSETNCGQLHPRDALKQYRKASGLNSKLAVVGMVSNGFTIADPNDAGMIDLIGFDTAAPSIMSDFFGGTEGIRESEDE